MTVMLLGGLWHGASWTFVVWGGLHGLFLMLERLQGKNSIYHRLPQALQVACTFLLLLITWVFFRAETMADATRYLGNMAGLGQQAAGSLLVGGIIYQPFYVVMMSVGAAVVWGGPQTWDWTRTLNPLKLTLCLLLFVLSVALLTAQAYNPFIYFIF